MTKMTERQSGSPKNALSDVKVVDFGMQIAAPLVAKYLADFGATVVKVEPPLSAGVDQLRNTLPMSKNIAGVNRGLIWHPYNCGKYDITLNLRHPKGVDVARKLVKWADVVIENLMPGAMERLGLGYQDLVKVNPHVIMVRATLQGREGPRANVGGLGIAMQGLTGCVYPLGSPGEEPTPIPVAITDFIAPFYMLPAILAALDYRRKTGEGKCIELSQYEAGVTFVTPQVLNFAANHEPQKRVGNASEHACPHNIYRCKGNDRWCAIAVSNEEEWTAFCRVLGSPSWTGDGSFSTFEMRKKNEIELDRLIEQCTVNNSPEEVMTKMQSAGVPAGVVQNGQDIHRDPQLAHRRHFRPLDHPEVGSFAYEAPSFHLSETPAEIEHGAPGLGEHTEFVCREILGLSDAEFLDLYGSGIFT